MCIYDFKKLQDHKKEIVIQQTEEELSSVIQDIQNFDKNAAIDNPDYLEDFLEGIAHTITHIKERARGDYGFSIYED